MSTLIFDRKHALEAINQARANGLDWLYESYPGLAGKPRKARTGFLMHEGHAWPVKALGRLASQIAGGPMTHNPNTNVFRKYFEILGFQLINSPEDEAEVAAERQRRLAEVWMRPHQAKFRDDVFKKFGARCLVTGCTTLKALEAAHILPVAGNGGDEAWNGIPLRADLHRLFDSGAILLDPDTWTLTVRAPDAEDYLEYDGMDLAPVFARVEDAPKTAAALRKRQG